MAKAGMFLFENGVPDEITADSHSHLSTSQTYSKIGRHSLKWDFQPESHLHIEQKIGFSPYKEENDSQKRSTFSIWIYNEEPIKDCLLFEFGRGRKVDCSFPFYLNFSGWRTAWVEFERDMTGTPCMEMDCLRISTSASIKSGTLYIDQIILSSLVDPRFPIRDSQVPFVNKAADERANRHWMSLYRFYRLAEEQKTNINVTDQELSAIKQIEKKLEREIFKSIAVSSEDILNIRQQFSAYHIEKREEIIRGPSITYTHYDDVYTSEQKDIVKTVVEHIDVKEYTTFMLDVAKTYRSTLNLEWRAELRAIFINLVWQLRDQGWAAGSGLGTLHHLGYNLENYYAAMLLMREELAKNQLKIKVSKDMYWYSGVGRIFVQDKTSGGIIDIFNTTLQGMIISILMLDKVEEKASHLYQLKKWVGQFLVPAPGLMSCFKLDGSVFHHLGHYPAYGIGGFRGVTPIVYYLATTSFQISKEAHESLRRSLMAMRLYCNKREWLLSLSGRHPTGVGQLDVASFKYLALAGTPDGNEEIDKEVAAAYLRLITDQPTQISEMHNFIQAGIQPEDSPTGHWSMNYAALSLHRRDNWLVGARGHSRYLWGNETYLKANLYGRYITYGHVQILGSGDPVNNYDSGFAHDGWDWNRWPGTTTIHLPFEQLRSKVRNVDDFSGFEEMLLSDETYMGSLHLLDQNGVFAMKLHEHPKYNGSHRARKSVFFFEDTIILLGSNIENNDQTHSTETTLFQNHLKDVNDPIWINGRKVNEFPLQQTFTETTWIMDNIGSGYYIPKGQKFTLAKGQQESRSQNKGEVTFGNFASAWLDHGTAPIEEQYEYAIKVKSTVEDLQQFAEKMTNADTAGYKVIQKDHQAHIVHHRPTQIIGYALFERNEHLENGIIQANDTPCMVMTHTNDRSLTISILDPDLGFYTGKDVSQYNEDGERVEVSMYSRPWIANEAKTSTIQIRLKGMWSLTEAFPSCQVISTDQNGTKLEFQLQGGTPQHMTLYSIK